jgi:hypothetical protein
VFEFWDGRRWQAADPVVTWLRLTDDGFDPQAEIRRVMDATAEATARMAAVGRLADRVGEAFGGHHNLGGYSRHGRRPERADAGPERLLDRPVSGRGWIPRSRVDSSSASPSRPGNGSVPVRTPAAF